MHLVERTTNWTHYSQIITEGEFYQPSGKKETFDTLRRQALQAGMRDVGHCKSHLIKRNTAQAAGFGSRCYSFCAPPHGPTHTHTRPTTWGTP